MPADILSGRDIAAAIRSELVDRVQVLEGQHGVVPGLATILVGDDPASELYVAMKNRAALEVGIHSEQIHLDPSTGEGALLDRISRLNRDTAVHSILVQLPLPDGFDEDRVLMEIDPAKDVDGFHPLNVGRMVLGDPAASIPCTPQGIVEMLLRSGIDPAGRHAVVIGRSRVVGRPLSVLLSRPGRGGNATVTLAHSRTRDLASLTLDADIVVAAAGRAGLVTSEMVRPGAVVIDVGTNRVEDPTRERGYRVVGDVDFDGVREVAGAISPVPGGVGPMTIAMLLSNTVLAAERAAGID